MIDVIMPAYNAHKFIKDALASIALQDIVKDLKVYIVNDCSDRDYSEEIKLFADKMVIKELKTPKNSGPGFARQYGVDNSDSEYIVFIDADDVFSGRYSISDLLYYIKEYESDVVISNFMEEYPGDNIIHKNNNIWMHGKIYRRSFLRDNNIIFNNSSSNEDTGFNTLTAICSDRIAYVDVLTYVWKYNEDSITRRNNSEFEFYGLKGFIENICWAAREAKTRKQNRSKIAKVLYESIIEIYYNYMKYFYDKNREKIIEWSRDLKELFLEFEDDIEDNSRFDCEINIMKKGIEIAGPDILLENNFSFKDFLEKI